VRHALLALLAVISSPSAGPAESGAAPPDVRGLPEGATLEAYSNPSLGQTILFARFPDDRTETVTVSIRDDRGEERALIPGTVEAGALLVIWDGRDGDGVPLPSGAYRADLAAGNTSLSAELILP